MVLDLTNYQTFLNDFIIRCLVITLVILINLIASVWESLKLKNFNVKKLPQFASDWLISILALAVVDLIVFVTTGWIKDIFAGSREIITLTIMWCFLKKMFESFKTIGWSVDTSKVTSFVDTQIQSGSTTTLSTNGLQGLGGATSKIITTVTTPDTPTVEPIDFSKGDLDSDSQGSTVNDISQSNPPSGY